MTSLRRLAAIMFTDIVGFTALMEEDEQATKQLVDGYRKILEESTLKFHGEVLRHLGDGSLVVFQSVVEAVRCARETQKEWLDNKIPVKIGIHVGDVVMENGDVYGDGVNIASRVETLAIAGSVLMTDRVIPEIKGHPDLSFQSIGTFQFKNVSKPTEVFALNSEGLVIPPRNKITGKISPNNTWRQSFRKAIGKYGIWILSVAILLYLVLQSVDNDQNKQLNRSLAVLPFTNMSTEENTDYFCDGVMEDILNRLSFVKDIKVISRTSSIQYRNTTKKLSDIANELGVQYIVEGSVRKNQNNIRIVATLVNAIEDTQLWSKSFDRELIDIFDIQSEVASQIVHSLESELNSDASTEINKKLTNNPDAYELYLKARQDMHSGDVYLDEALEKLQLAISLDPDFYEAKAEIANVLFRQGYFAVKDDKIAFQLAESIAKEVIESNPNSVRAHSVLGQVDWFYRRWESAIDHMKICISNNPNDADSYDYYSDILAYTGEFETAIQMVRKATELNPLSPVFHRHLAEILTFSGKLDSAAITFERFRLLFPKSYQHEEAELFIARGEYDRAAKIYQDLWDFAPQFGRFKLGHLSTLYALMGQNDRALETKNLIDKTNVEYNSAMGLSFIGTDQPDSTFYYLNIALDRYEGNIAMILCQPIFKLISDDHRFPDLLQKAGLIEYWERNN